jgi:hypothetical protein
MAMTAAIGVMGWGVRIGRLRRLTGSYFDPAWHRFARNGLFALIPASSGLMLVTLVTLFPPPRPGEAAGSIEAVAVVVGLGLTFWGLVTFFWPAPFLKARWIRDFERELNGVPMEFRAAKQARMMYEVRPPLNWSKILDKIPFITSRTRRHPRRRRREVRR